MKYPWRLQAAGWSLAAVLSFASALAVPAEFQKGSPLYEAISLGVLGLLVSSGLWWIYRRALPPSGPRMYLGAIAGTVVGTLVWYALLHLLDWAIDYSAFDSPFDLGPLELASDLIIYFFNMAAWHGALLASQAITRAANAERLAQQARLQALRYQLNPHFLFNALNSVIAMIDEDPRRAQTMLTKLSGLLRHTLKDQSSGASSLGDELDVVQRYLEIERVRFEDKLDVRFDVAEAARACPLPPLLLHALVDNAVKHGMRTSAMPLVVRLSAAVDAGGTLRLAVHNTGRLDDPDTGAGAGVGLRNVAERLDALYPGRHAFTIAQDGSGVLATVEIRGQAGA